MHRGIATDQGPPGAHGWARFAPDLQRDHCGACGPPPSIRVWRPCYVGLSRSSRLGGRSRHGSGLLGWARFAPGVGIVLQGRWRWGTAGAGPGILFGLGSPLALWTRPCTACGPPPSVQVGRLVLGWLGGARGCAPTNNCGGGGGGGLLEVGLVHTVGLASPLICNGATVARAGLRPRFGRGGPAMSARVGRPVCSGSARPWTRGLGPVCAVCGQLGTVCGPPPSVRVGRLVPGWLGGARVCAPTNKGHPFVQGHCYRSGPPFAKGHRCRSRPPFTQGHRCISGPPLHRGIATY